MVESVNISATGESDRRRVEEAGTNVTGEAIELKQADPHFLATAFNTYRTLREQGRVNQVHVEMGGGAQQEPTRSTNRLADYDSLFVARYDDVVAALLEERFRVDPRSLMTPGERAAEPETPDEFRPIRDSIISIDPPDHDRVRKLVQPTFTGRNMDAMRSRIQQTVDELLDEAERLAVERGETEPNRRLDLIPQFAYPFPVTVISDLLGIPSEDRDRIRDWTENLLQRSQDDARAQRVRTGLRDFAAYLKELFARKRMEPGDDMISRMVLAVDGDETLTEDEMLATTFLMYLAGHVTTVNLVGNGIVALLTNPDQLALVRADSGLVKNMVEETLRFWGPVDFVSARFASEKMEVAGAVAPRGQQFTIGLAAANHDPDRFANPDTFDVTRKEANRHVAFGKGIHVCLGAPLARMEGLVAFETLLRRYPALRLAVPEDELTWAGAFLRGFHQIPLLF